MKKFLTFTLLLLAVTAQAQGEQTIDDLFGGFEALYGALVIIAGYFTHLIPGLDKIPNNTLRVITFAIITGVAFVMFGANAIGVVLSYAAAHGIYAIILKWVIPNRGEVEILKKQ